MDKKVFDRMPFQINNTELERAIVDYTSAKDIKKLEELITIFKGSDVIVPVAFPRDTDMSLVFRMMRGQPLKKHEKVTMLPLTLTNPEGDKFAPAFTTRDKVKDVKDFPYMIRVPAEQVVRNVLNEKANLSGVLINPQTKGFAIRKKAFEADFSNMGNQGSPHRTVKKVSREEFVVMARNSVEKELMPKMLFEQGQDFMRKLDEGGAEFLRHLYSRPYKDKVPCPWTPDDFSVMSLDIDEETTASCIELPKRGVFVHAALSAYLICNPSTGEVHYYMIEKGEQGESDVLCNVTPAGKHQELMSAPPAGSELSAVLELIREEREELE